MKRLLALFAILSLTVFTTNAAKAVNLLSNPDIDVSAVGDQVLATPVGGWHVNSTRSISGAFTDGASSEGFCNVLQAGGTGLFYKAFQGDPSGPNGKITTNLYQDVAGTAGSSYTLSGWAGAGGGYIGLTDATVGSELAIDFLNGASTVIGGVTLSLRPGLIANQGNGNPFGYQQYFVTAVAPAGTAFVRSRGTQRSAYNNPTGGDQAYVMDTFDLERNVPEPTTIGLGLIGILGLLGSVRRR